MSAGAAAVAVAHCSTNQGALVAQDYQNTILQTLSQFEQTARKDGP